MNDTKDAQDVQSVQNVKDALTVDVQDTVSEVLVHGVNDVEVLFEDSSNRWQITEDAELESKTSLSLQQLQCYQ